MADVIDALEEQAFGLTECSSSSGVCAIESDCRIRENWMRINTVVRQALQAVNIADMVVGQNEAGVSALMVIATDEDVPDEVVAALAAKESVRSVIRVRG